MRAPSPRFIRLVFILSLTITWTFQSGIVRAQDPADVYLTGYMQVREAEAALRAGDIDKAYRKFADSEKIFRTIAQRWKDFEPDMVDFRRRKINEALSKIEQTPGWDGPTQGYPRRTPRERPSGHGTRPPAGDAMTELMAQKDAEIKRLERERVEQGRQLALKDRELMQALAKGNAANTRIELMQKQLAQTQEDLTKAHNSGSTEAAKLKDEVARLNNELAIANKNAKEAADLAEKLQQELDKASNYELSRKADRSELEAERARLQKLLSGSENEQIQSLVAENKRLRKDLEEARKEAGELRKENSDNKKLIAELRSKITTVEAELAKLQEENAGYRKQVAELTQQLKNTDAQLDAMAKSKGGANPILVKENSVLRDIIKKQLKSQTRRKQAKERVVAELAKLEIGSKEVLDIIDQMGDDAPLTQEEIETFQRSSGFSQTIIDEGTGNGKMPEFEKIDSNDGPKTKIGLNEDLTQFAKAAAFDFFQGNFNRSETSYEQILRIAPDNVHSLRNLGIVKIRLSKWEEAQTTLEKALAYAPEDHYTHYVLGVLHYRLQQPDAAIKSMEESLRLNPSNPRARFYIAVICMEQKQGGQGRRDPARAVAELKQVIKLDPKYGDAHFNLAILYIEAPQPQYLEAREHYRQAVRLGSEASPEMERLLGT